MSTDLTAEHKHSTPQTTDATLCCASCGFPLRREDSRVKDGVLVHHLCPIDDDWWHPKDCHAAGQCVHLDGLQS